MSGSELVKLNIEPRSESSESKDDTERKELLWTGKQEQILKEWKAEMIQRSEFHGLKGRKYRKLYNLFGLPSVIIPIVLSALSDTLKKENYDLINALLLLSAGVFAGVNAFLNFGKKFANHIEFENRYDELARRIDKELAKPKKNRLACDVYMEKIQLRYSSLNVRAPR